MVTDFYPYRLFIIPLSNKYTNTQIKNSRINGIALQFQNHAKEHQELSPILCGLRHIKVTHGMKSSSKVFVNLFQPIQIYIFVKESQHKIH